LKKGAIIIIIFLMAAAAVLAYYLQQKRAVFVGSPYSTIPMDAGLIVEAVNLPDLIESLVSDSYFMDEMRGIKAFDKFTGGVEAIDSLLHTKSIRGLAASGEVLISFHRIGKDRVEAFFALSLAPEIKERHIRDLLSENSELTSGIKEYQGFRVFEISSRGAESRNFYLSFVNGVLLLSRSNLLIEAGIRQSEQLIDIRSMPGFSEVAAAAGKNDNKIYLVFENFQKILSILASDANSHPWNKIAMLAGSSETDFYLKNNNINISGYIETSDTSQILHKYSASSPGSFQAYQLIPASVAMFESLIGKKEGRSGFNQGTGRITRYLADIVNSQYENEAVKLYFDINGGEISRMALFRLKGQNSVENAFREELNSYYAKEGSGDTDFIITYKPDEGTQFTFYRLPDNKLPSLIAGGFAGSSDLKYATFFRGYLVLGESTGSLSKLIYDNLLNRTLANSMVYRNFENTMPSRSSYYFYCVPSKIPLILEGIMKEDILKGLDENMNSLKKIEALGLQFSPSNEMLYLTLSVSIRKEVKEEARALWESLLDTVLASKPMYFTNHYTNRNEIFVQDLNNNVYLINSAGRILWKLRLKERIQGQPVMIDYYRNSKYQILFATRNKLHLLDRNGNYVERYPVSLRSPATNGLSVFDYEQNQDYRLFICGEDRVVYLYDKTGSTVKGWEQFKTSGQVKLDVEYFRVSGKDYLIINDDDNMYILDRRGNKRVSVKEQVSRARGSMVRLSTETAPRLVLSSADGKLKYISLNGDVETKELGEFSENHVFEYFDIDADGLGEYFFFDKDKITAFDNNYSKLFVEQLETGNFFGPYGLVFSSTDHKLGYVDAASGEVHLIDEKGREQNGFPLPGNTPFSVGKLGSTSSFNLITGGNDSFIYNYELKR
jgi:hypothetical protein